MSNMISWIVWSLGSLYFLTEYFVRVSTGVLSVHILSEFNTNATHIGLLSGYFYYSYVTAQIPVGILADRLSIRYLLSINTLLFGVSCIAFASMKNIEIGYILRLIMGLTGAFAFVGTLKLITIYFRPNQFALLAGITQGAGMVGAIIGAAPMSYIFGLIGWRQSFTDFGIMFIVLSILMIVLIRDKQSNATLQMYNNTLYADIKAVLSSKQTWLNCMFIGCMFAPTEIFGEQWGIMFCHSVNPALTITQVAWQVGCIFVGMSIGCPLLGLISDKIQSRIKVMRVCSIICLLTISPIIYISTMHIVLPYIVECIIMFTYGICAAAIVPSYAVAAELHSTRISGLAIGITNMATVLVGAICIPLIGKILDIMKNLNHESSYSTNDFHIAFLIVPICCFACVLLTYSIKETFKLYPDSAT